ncbi:MAG TPA: 23S rRNA (uracil(1939)-C(5))-methyltransferase RlmD [Chryseolinea sp.]|nr:23S rRNA (uracil(1939)-C(5))-methyltransferase RlmD [Chryseolinea sp.]HPM29788.1 23S rRNA (uracil(1939)-C(5))-methyltransferase RlmD [Chryseolinea sp.]
MKKGDVIEDIVVETMAAEGKCLSRVNGLVLFIEGAAPGDTVDVSLTKIKSSFLEGKVVQIKKLSTNRATPFCSHFGLCGGCSWQHLQYSIQLTYKQQQVIDNLERIGGLTLPTISTIIASDKIKYYRNKLDYTFSSHRWLTYEEVADRKAIALKEGLDEVTIPAEPALGYHMPKKFDRVFDVKECFLQPEPSNGIRLAVKDEAVKNNIPFFDLRRQTGFLRTITIRTANTGETMIILQVTEDKIEWTEKILNRLEKDFPQITSFNYIINAKRNDTFHDLDIICWKGNPYITEQMQKPDGSGTLQFRVGPKSFYQTNSDQAFELYKVAWKLAELKGDELVYDLYTGTGTIANFVAGQAKKVIGLEYVAAAIDDAKVNSQINGITNTDFYAGDIKDLLDDEFLSVHGRPDTIITDPPRNGMHEDVCKMLLKAEPKVIVYVSCNPATQARDLKILSEKYDIAAVQPVDMFPHTTHVENVVRLVRRS